MTRKMTPMHEPAKAPLLVTCQLVEMKQASTVYQFHSIYEVTEVSIVIPLGVLEHDASAWLRILSR